MVTTVARRIFVDTNVITNATIDAAPFHTQAVERLDTLWEIGARLYVSHQVIREYMVNATRNQTYSLALPMPLVLGQVEDLRMGFYILSEEPAILDMLFHLAGNVAFGGKQVHDANIVATMLVNGIDELLTNNVKDFERFESYFRMIPLVETAQ